MAGIAQNIVERLKQRWNLRSMTQFWLVMLVFACTGLSVLLIKKPLFALFGMNHLEGWLYSLIYLLLILPMYQILLLFFGFLFGQFRFFWEYERRMMRRIIGKSQKKSQTIPESNRPLVGPKTYIWPKIQRHENSRRKGVCNYWRIPRHW